MQPHKNSERRKVDIPNLVPITAGDETRPGPFFKMDQVTLLYLTGIAYLGRSHTLVTSSIIQYSKTLLIEFHQNRILMMYILNNVTKQPPDCIKNIMVKIILKIDV